jgi:ATP-dependent Lon protease
MRMPDGSQRIVLQGLRRVAIAEAEWVDGRIAVRASEPNHVVYDEADLRKGVSRAMELCVALVRADERYSSELPRVLALNTNAAGHFVDLAAARLHLSYEDCRALLVVHDVARRLQLLIDVLTRELARAELAHGLQHKVQERMRQGFLREQLEVIRGELGQLDPRESEASRAATCPPPRAGAASASSRTSAALRRARPTRSASAPGSSGRSTCRGATRAPTPRQVPKTSRA